MQPWHTRCFATEPFKYTKLGEHAEQTHLPQIRQWCLVNLPTGARQRLQLGLLPSHLSLGTPDLRNVDSRTDDGTVLVEAREDIVGVRSVPFNPKKLTNIYAGN